ncbi:MAG: hypothetical protein ABSF69_20440 [Polyangiaceae bacterium]|jgi:hypothetical protein
MAISTDSSPTVNHNRLLRRDVFFGALIFALSLSVLRCAPVQQAGDSRYTMLLAENLIRHGEFALDRYGLPEHDYRIEHANGHDYYSFPPGSPVLSVPFVAAMHFRGVSVVAPDGSYQPARELALDRNLAGLLMAVFATLAYASSRLLLPVGWSFVAACVSTFGTQVFSTASRSMWSDTWGIVLVSVAVLLLLRSAVKSAPLHVPLLATLQSLAYFVRPTNSLVLVGTIVYLVCIHRKAIWTYVAVLAFWLSVFVYYSWSHFHTVLPKYFATGRLHFPGPQGALIGNLISPSRGLFVYVPAVIAIGLALIRSWRYVRFRALAALAAFVICGHLVMLAGFGHWWGGHSYGARLTTSLVPWFLLLGVLAVDASRRAMLRGRRPADVAVDAVAAVLCVASIVMNGIGAFSWDANYWNGTPNNVDLAPERLWSWRHPQFAAAFAKPEGPFPPMPAGGLALGTAASDPYLGAGWADGERDFRWAVGREDSVVRFRVPEARSGTLEMDLGAYLLPGKLPEQRLIVSMNDREIADLSIQKRAFDVYRFVVPDGVMREANVLCLRHPDAASPAALEGKRDSRLLGMIVRSIRWRSEGPAP